VSRFATSHTRYIMRSNFSRAGLFKLRVGRFHTKVSRLPHTSLVCMHIVVALCILWRCFTLLPTTALNPALYWLRRCSARRLCRGGKTALPTTAGKHEGAILAPNLLAREYLITGRTSSSPSLGDRTAWRPAGLSKPTGLDGRALERSQQPLVSLPLN